MPHRSDVITDAAPRNYVATSVLHNRAFVELSRVLASGDPAVLSSALPVIVRGAGVPSAAAFTFAQGELVLSAAEGVPLKLRAYLEEPSLTGSSDFVGRRALAQRRTIIDGDLFGEGSAGARAALEEAGWQCGVAVPILGGGSAVAVLVAGARTGAVDGSAITFLEAASNVLGAALGKPASKGPLSPPARLACAGCGAHLGDCLTALGRELAVQGALIRELCRRQGAPAEADVLARHTRTMDRHFRRVAEAVFHLPVPACAHGRRPASLAVAVDIAVRDAQPALAAARAEVEVVCMPPCSFEGDPELLAVAARHLVINAAEAFDGSPEQSAIPTARRHVRLCARSEGPNVALHVEDSGPGVPQDLRGRVFEPSFTTKGPGRGLGLALVRSIVEAHGGWLELGASELGGARLSVLIPAHSSSLEEFRKAPTLPQFASPLANRRPSRPTG